MSYKRKVILSIAFVILSVIISYSAMSYETIAKINEKVIRLHVIANSDKPDDQALKYRVRNDILIKFNKEFENTLTKAKSETEIIQKIDEIRNYAQETVIKEGYSYPVNVYYGKYNFPRKTYDNITLPQGYYDALRIEIGQAMGENWWCVMFPPMCFTDFGKKDSFVLDYDTQKKLEEVLTKEEIEEIKKKRGLEDIKLKSKIFEFIEKGRVENQQKTYVKSLNTTTNFQ